jgi:hypothetical protein
MCPEMSHVMHNAVHMLSRQLLTVMTQKQEPCVH